jgi:hypothetical protein
MSSVQAMFFGELMLPVCDQPSSRINAHFCNFIFWFIFNQQRKNKEIEIVAKYTMGDKKRSPVVPYFSSSQISL